MTILVLHLVFALLAYEVSTIVVHELGHGLAATALRIPWRPTIHRGRPGILIAPDDRRLKPWQRRVTAAGGPLANAAVAVAALKLGLPLLFEMNALFAVANLLPFRIADGRRIITGAA